MHKGAYSRQEAADYLGISLTSFGKVVDSGHILPTRLLGLPAKEVFMIETLEKYRKRCMEAVGGSVAHPSRGIGRDNAPVIIPPQERRR